ncbi:MAG TPA: ArsR family transcriptional regulator [Polyangia bacterium]|nr:ArsR family transcriptional regulator [Polyangia bacterium]
MSADDVNSELARARDLGIDTCGRIAEFWGFTRTMGRAFGLLYLSREPLPQTEIQKRLGISAGSASMTLAALGRWGVVHRIWVRGQRREHYEAETDFWKMIAGVLNERERREISAAVTAVERAETGVRAAQAAARAQGGLAGKKLKAEADFTAVRLAQLGEICRLGETMLNMLLGQLTLDVAQFRHVLKVDSPTMSETPSQPPPSSASPSPLPAKEKRSRR